jgi:hypothetical protein
MELKIELDEIQEGILNSIKDYYTEEYSRNFDDMESVVAFLIYKEYLVCQAIKREKESDKNENKDIV